ncbi:Bcr/CflA family multidrug efflux MFS transporter [Testudinibacter aquarius]|uniref:Bcr/CflA family efflux transporter n=1 Tax=Testudinibacter aquarius TaxID=1524974 RepID=A0A4R3XXN1_9PAST|nr:Bcr/CflA family multidrug efflux MFS transporter [Testudinibacter aquarius]KAE9529934.1 Bcr/CflA family multidrug efflux transporter [Testudinibacter aquarius]TCV83832.1 DHA1 family bicyclomycin/chloramphenicol resistance-like MFS transporter [Testudinibacter aquarius]TNG91441.1 Bcr/CflA family multidrug efflux MFS transporter [Testudinibacter aquarius]
MLQTGKIRHIKKSPIFVLILGILAMLPPLAIDMYLPSFLDIARDLNVNSERVQNTLALFTLGFAAGQLLWGPAADSFGRKPVIMIGTLIFALTALFLTQVDNIQEFLVLRFIQGFFGAAPAVVLGALLRDLFSKNYFSKMMSMIMLVSMIAPLLAPFIGGYLAKFFHWHSIFYVLAFFGVLSCLLVFWKIPESHPIEKRVPFSLKVVMRNFASLIRVKAVVGYVLAGAFSFAGMFSFLTSGSIVYIDIYGVAPEHFGYFFVMNMTVLILFTSINGKMVLQVGAEKMLRFGLSIQFLAGIWLLLVAILDLGFWPMALGVSAFVGMLSTIGSNAMAAILDRFPQVAGTANSLAGTIRFGIGAVVGFLIALVPISNAVPMLLSMFLCTLLSVLSYYFLTYRSLKSV